MSTQRRAKGFGCFASTAFGGLEIVKSSFSGPGRPHHWTEAVRPYASRSSLASGELSRKPTSGYREGEPDHWSECGRAISVANSDALGRPHRSVFPLARRTVVKYTSISDPQFNKAVSLRQAYRICYQFIADYHSRGDTPVVDFLAGSGIKKGWLTKAFSG